jgi:hypothetical protein
VADPPSPQGRWRARQGRSMRRSMLVAVFFIEAAAPRVASGLDGVSSRLGAIGDMRTNAQPASRNERITWITSPSCRTAIGRPQRRKTFSMGRLRESTSASSQSRPFTRAMAMI